MASLYATGEVADDSDGGRVGGRPIAPHGMVWPTCKACNGALEFTAQHPLDGGRHVLAFQCNNNPGMCEEWDPASGANLVVVASGGVPLDPPTDAKAATFGPAIGLATSGEREAGRLGGEPEWIQHDETPECCGQPMRFVMQLEESMHPHLNFCGGGAAYIFVCGGCDKGAYIMQQ